MTTRPQSEVRKLSELAQSLLHRMIDQEEKAAVIARAIRQQTGERLAPSAITRYASGYRKRRQRQQQLQERMDSFLSLVRKDGIAVSDLLRAVLIERLSTAGADGSAAELDLLKLEEAERKRGEYELKQRQAHFSNLYREQEMELKQRRHALAEKEFRLQRKKAKANFQELEGKAAAGKPITRDDIRQIREIYGLDSSGLATRDSRLGTQESGVISG